MCVNCMIRPTQPEVQSMQFKHHSNKSIIAGVIIHFVNHRWTKTNRKPINKEPTIQNTNLCAYAEPNIHNAYHRTAKQTTSIITGFTYSKGLSNQSKLSRSLLLKEGNQDRINPTTYLHVDVLILLEESQGQTLVVWHISFSRWALVTKMGCGANRLCFNRGYIRNKHGNYYKTVHV